MKLHYKLKISTLDNGKKFCLPSHYRNGNDEWVEVPFLFGSYLIGNEQVKLSELYSWAYDEQKDLVAKGCYTTALAYQLFTDHLFEVVETKYLANIYPL